MKNKKLNNNNKNKSNNNNNLMKINKILQSKNKQKILSKKMIGKKK